MSELNPFHDLFHTLHAYLPQYFRSGYVYIQKVPLIPSSQGGN